MFKRVTGAIKPKSEHNSVAHFIRMTALDKATIKKHNIKPIDFRRFIRQYETKGADQLIDSNDWQTLANILNNVPSLQLVGDIGAGKSHLIKLLVKNDTSKRYIVMDSHDEHKDLEIVSQIPTTDPGKNVRLSVQRFADAARTIFKLNYNVLTSNEWPDNYVFIVEEALRYKTDGLKNLMAESRKFLKVIAVCQEKMFNFCPSVRVSPFNRYL